jgi:hypothetical protein
MPPKAEPSPPAAVAEAKSDNELIKVFLNYGLVFLVISYLNYINLPRAIEVFIEYHEKGLAAHNHGGQVQTPQVTQPKNQPAMIQPTGKPPGLDLSTTGFKFFQDEGFDDAAFMASYECDPNHGYQLEVWSRDPLVMRIRGFMTDGEADHLKAIA